MCAKDWKDTVISEFKYLIYHGCIKFQGSMQFLKPRLACASFQIPRSQYLVRLHKSGRASRTVTMASNIADEARPVEGKVVVIPDASEEQILGLGVRSWPTWSCEASVFPWTYSMGNETCYLLEGEVTVTPEGGEPTSFKAGDIVSFPRDMKCTWDVKAAVLKHYTFF